MRETFDVMSVPFGRSPGISLLNKLQLSGTLRGDQFGLEGWSAHAQLFRFDGQSLSRRLGDLQTADNIEAVPVTRLFEAYLARLWGKGDRTVAVRLGLIDLNSQFDSIDAASLMLNSSHGIAPDLSRSGLNGPSIYPVTAVGSTVTWVRSPRLTLRLGVFDGVAGSPALPHAFLAERLSPHDGVLVIAQVDDHLDKDRRIEGGAWGYTAATGGVADPAAHGRGAYLSYQGPTAWLPRLSWWLRGGVANGRAQAVEDYAGGGLVQQGTFAGRPKDRLGLALAHAVVGHDAAALGGTHRAETSVELTYQAVIGDRFVVQPDLDFVHHPAGLAHAPDSLAVGLRLVFVAAHPGSLKASDPGDPTVPPDAL